MNINMKEKQIEEALTRMTMLHMSSRCINEFKRGNVWESEGFGALYEISEDEQKIVDKFEKGHNAVVYHMIHNVFEFGECYTILYVSQDEDEWEEDKQDLQDGYAMAYVENVDCPEFSEFGSVAIKPSIGGLVRLG